MAISTYPNMGGATNNTNAATFIPEIWSDEIRAAYEKNLILANLVKKMGMTGKKGDTIHIPAPTRGSASAKASTVAVTLLTLRRKTLPLHFKTQLKAKCKLLSTSTTSILVLLKISLRHKPFLLCVTFIHLMQDTRYHAR